MKFLKLYKEHTYYGYHSFNRYEFSCSILILSIPSLNITSLFQPSLFYKQALMVSNIYKLFIYYILYK